MEAFVRVVAAGIRYDARSNDVLPPYLMFIEYTKISTKLFIKTPPHNNYPIISSLLYQKIYL